MHNKSWVCKVSWILVLVGAVNWGLVGALDMNLVMMLFGSWPMVEKAVYILVGVAGVMGFLEMFGVCGKGCKDSCGPSDGGAPAGGAPGGM